MSKLILMGITGPNKENHLRELIEPISMKIPNYKWKLMSIAKKTGGWDLWLGKKWGWELDDDMFSKPHWHFKHYPFVVYRDEY